MKPGTKWIVAVAGLLAINMLAAILLMIFANDSAHSRVLPAYEHEARAR